MFSNALLLALVATTSLHTTARADFLVYTEPPIPTTAIPTFANPSDAAQWTTSIFFAAQLTYGRFESSLGPTYRSSQSSAASLLSAFAATATNYSIPVQALVTDAPTLTLYSKPEWWTAMPSPVRELKERQVSDQFEIVRSVIARGEGSVASRTSSGVGALRTAVGVWEGGVGVGVGAVIAAAAGLL